MVSEENRTRQSGAWETAATDPQETFGWLRSDAGNQCMGLLTRSRSVRQRNACVRNSGYI